jgi:hypothetical protein
MKLEYLLLSDNCYFYAGTIIKVLQEWYNPTFDIETTKMTDRDRKWSVLSSRKGKERKVGGWHGFEIYAGENVNTECLIEKCGKESISKTQFYFMIFVATLWYLVLLYNIMCYFTLFRTI